MINIKYMWLTYRYKVDYDPNHEVELELGAVLRARNDIKLKLSFLS